MNIENIPGFEQTPDLETIADVSKVCKIANIIMPRWLDNDFFENGEAIKKLLDDRRELTKLCLAMYRILFYAYTNPPALFETDVWKVLEGATGKKIDELLKMDCNHQNLSTFNWIERDYKLKCPDCKFWISYEEIEKRELLHPELDKKMKDKGDKS